MIALGVYRYEFDDYLRRYPRRGLVYLTERYYDHTWRCGGIGWYEDEPHPDPVSWTEAYLLAERARGHFVPCPETAWLIATLSEDWALGWAAGDPAP